MSIKHEWSCGHLATAMCQECWRALADKAAHLAEDNLTLRSEIEQLRTINARLRAEIELVSK